MSKASAEGLVICPVCGRAVAWRIPRGGDGSAFSPVWHKVKGQPCDGRFCLVVETVEADG